MTPSPTQSPSKAPSLSPTGSLKPSIGPTNEYQQESDGATENVVTITTSITTTITGTYSNMNAAQEDCPTEVELQDQADALCGGEPNCIATVAFSSCVVKAARRRRELLRSSERQLQTATYTVTSKADFSITIKNWCPDCDKATIQAIVDDITSTVTANAATISVTCPSGKTCSTVKADITVSAPLLTDISRWYPSWSDNKDTCANDGNYELYSKFLYAQSNSFFVSFSDIIKNSP